MQRIVCLTIVAFLLGAPNGPGAVRQDPAELAVVALTRETRADYIVITDTMTFFDGERRQFPSGEFHSGKFHRIEELNNRVVANCASRGGHRLWLPEDKVFSSPDEADRACGVGPYGAEAAVSLVGRPATPFGAATRVRVNYGGFRRTYDVLADGAIVRNEWKESKAGGATIYLSVATAYCPKALPPAAFTKDSLRQSNLDDPCGR